MGSNPPPVVILYPSGTVIDYGESVSRIFCANVTQPATITFYFNGVAQAPTFGQIATFSCVNQGTHHVIQVVASNENGSSQASCDWYVEDEPCNPPAVERITPLSAFVIDAIGESRTFTAEVTSDPDFPSTVGFYLDGEFLFAGSSATLTATAGTHTVKVVAIGCGIREVTWTWYVPDDPLSDPTHTSQAYQKPVVTKVSPTTDQIPDVLVDTTEPLEIVVSVNQPSTVSMTIDGVIFDTHGVSVSNSMVTFTIGLSYLNNPDNIGKHSIAIYASNSNGTSDPVTYTWNLVGLSNALLSGDIIIDCVCKWRTRADKNSPWGTWQNANHCNLNAAINFAFAGSPTLAEQALLENYQWKYFAKKPETDSDTYAQPYILPEGPKGLPLFHVKRIGPDSCENVEERGHAMLAFYHGPETDEGYQTWSNW
jgi:hypothetical protein